MRDDIIGGLKNALDRGVSLESAIKSFVNAGYSEKEVKAAADVILGGSALYSPTRDIRINDKSEVTKPPEGKPKQLPRSFTPPKKKSSRLLFKRIKYLFNKIPMKVVILSSILIVLLVLLILSLVFRKTIVNILS